MMQLGVGARTKQCKLMRHCGALKANNLTSVQMFSPSRVHDAVGPEKKQLMQSNQPNISLPNAIKPTKHITTQMQSNQPNISLPNAIKPTKHITTQMIEWNDVVLIGV
jgi:hypothetical protein